MQLNLGALFPQHKYKRRNTVQLGGPAHTGKGFRDCGVHGAWVVREGFKEEAQCGWSGKASRRRRACGGAFEESRKT